MVTLGKFAVHLSVPAKDRVNLGRSPLRVSSVTRRGDFRGANAFPSGFIFDG